MNEFNVLYVDDNSDMLETLKADFKDKDINCYTANSGEKAYDIFNREKINLIILDIEVNVRTGTPVDNWGGIKIKKEIENTDAYKMDPVPIYFFSGYEKSLGSIENISDEISSEHLFDKSEKGIDRLIEKVVSLRMNPSSENMHQIEQKFNKEIEWLNQEVDVPTIKLFKKVALAIKMEERPVYEIIADERHLIEDVLTAISEKYVPPTYIESYDKEKQYPCQGTRGLIIKNYIKQLCNDKIYNKDYQNIIMSSWSITSAYGNHIDWKNRPPYINFYLVVSIFNSIVSLINVFINHSEAKQFH